MPQDGGLATLGDQGEGLNHLPTHLPSKVAAMPEDPRVDTKTALAPAGHLQEAQLELSPAILGLPRPSTGVRLALVARESGWRGLAWTLQADHEALRRWMTRQRDLRRLDASQASDEVAVIALGPDHPACAWLVREPGWTQISLGPEGPALLSTSGTATHLEDLHANLVRQARARGQDPPVDWTPKPTRHALLTPRQHEAVRWALTAGYYSVPRGIRLKDLADQMETSIGALSTLLRRAEARLLEAYLDAEPLLGDLLDAVSLTREVPRGATWRTVTDGV